MSGEANNEETDDRPIVAASSDEVATHVLRIVRGAVDELEEMEARSGAVRVCAHVPAVVESGVPWVYACADHPRGGLLCLPCLEVHAVEHGTPRTCSACDRSDGTVDPAVTEPWTVRGQPVEVTGSGERFAIRRAEMVVLLHLCDDCRLRGYDQAREIEVLERRLHEPEDVR